jgi:four helix bundle protein
MYIEKTKVQSYRDLIAWKKAKQLCLKVYRHFHLCRDFGFRDQIQRASISIVNNIAEGYERSSDKELGRYLAIARGSCSELRSMLDLAIDLGYLSAKEYEELMILAEDVAKLLGAFSKTVGGLRFAKGER